MSTKIRVYVAGPYTHPDPCINVRRAVEAAEELVDDGFIPYVPHLTHLWHLISPHNIEFWYEYDLEWLSCCHALLRLEGVSIGADREVNVAKIKSIPVFYSVFDVVKWRARYEGR